MSKPREVPRRDADTTGNIWEIYEIEKAKIAATTKENAEYERRVRELVDRLKI